MDKHLEARYNVATRFDESDLALSVRYKDIMHKLLDCMDQLALLGPTAATLAEELLESTYEVTGFPPKLEQVGRLPSVL